jgi:hypothetical protein
MDKVDLFGAWTGLWGRVTGAAGVDQLMTLATYVGVGLVAFSIGKWAWSRRKGGAQAGSIGWPLAVGAMLAAPNAVIPAVLWMADGVANIVVNILK